jgi:branched-chain amino acid transport system ATP-binding protein
MENLELGAYLRNDKDGIARDLEDVFKKFPRLLERKDQISGTLSGGEQQMLAMGRALMSRPRLLLLDVQYKSNARTIRLQCRQKQPPA